MAATSGTLLSGGRDGTGPDAPAERSQHLVFRIGEVSAALPVSGIVEVVRRPEVLPVPLSPPAVEGLMNLRGTVTVLVNMRTALGLPAAAADESVRIIVLGGGARVGLQVDRIAGMIATAPGETGRGSRRSGGFAAGPGTGAAAHCRRDRAAGPPILRRIELRRHPDGDGAGGGGNADAGQLRSRRRGIRDPGLRRARDRPAAGRRRPDARMPTATTWAS